MIISLLGYMGCGKSSLGKKLANKLSFDFIDLDNEIEKLEGKTVSKIFEEKGEIYFRSLERKLLKENLKKNNTVLSLGGGTPCYGNNIDLINKKSHSVFINLPIKTLVQRLEQGKHKRPIIAEKSQEELERFIEQHLNERLPFYKKAKTEYDSLKENIDTLISYFK